MDFYRYNPDIDYRTVERIILSGAADAEDWINFYRHQRFLGNRNYRCGCALFHQIIPCEIPYCLNPIPRFFCDDEDCFLCSACNSTSHSIHYECDRCFRKGCQFHFEECTDCEFKFCPSHLNEAGLCRGMRIESSMPGLLPHGYVRGCADL